MADLRIFFTLLEDSSPSQDMFPILVSPNIYVGELKELVHAKALSSLNGIDARNLTLWKLNNPIPVDDADAGVAALRQNLSTFATEMKPGRSLAFYFATAPEGGHLHIIVQAPSLPLAGEKHDRLSEDDADSEPASKRKKGPRHSGSETVLVQEAAQRNTSQTRRPSPPTARIDGSIAQRELTVAELYQRLNHERFVLVRGTPASGKSTLAELLRMHISREEAGVQPVVISKWPADKADWRERLGDQYDASVPNTIIIDEAQLTYSDTDFWNQFLKSITLNSLDRVILFASYGSPTGRVSVEGTPMTVSDFSRIGLRPVDHGDGYPSPGLFLLRDEFNDMVEKFPKVVRFAADFLDFVFDASTGHSGAVYDLLQVVMSDDSYRGLKQAGGEYSLNIFYRHFSMEKLWEGLRSRGIFRRGLPELEDLRKPDIARIFRAVLRNNHVTKEELDSTNQASLDVCFKQGWLHAVKSEEEATLYIFTTHLHRWFVEYYLGTTVLDDNPIAGLDLLSFAIEVIQRFSPIQLLSQRKIGTSGTQRPPEAQFQDEFYRCCHTYSKGSLISFPEFGNALGRIDFYIPFKRWGVELLRDGDQLENHSSRFTGAGPYVKMDFKDYILLDFRTKVVRKEHPGIPKLYHVVFASDYRHVQIIRGSPLEVVKEFELLNSS